MKGLSLILLGVLFSWHVTGQNTYFKTGDFQLGTEFTKNLALPDNYKGFGVGFQAKYFLMSYLCLEAGYGYSVLDLGQAGSNKSSQIAISCLYYPKEMGRFNPYIAVGYGYNNVEVLPGSYLYIDRTEDLISGAYSRLNFGLGTNYNITDDRFNLGLGVQYGLPVTDQLRYELEEGNAGFNVNTNISETREIETLQHINLVLRLNYRITNFSKSK